MPNFNTREAEALNKATAKAKLATLAGDESKFIRFRVAENPNTSKAALLTLAGDPEQVIRRQVVEHAAVDLEVLAALAVDAPAILQKAILSHAMVSEQLRQSIIDAMPKAKVKPEVQWYPAEWQAELDAMISPEIPVVE